MINDEDKHWFYRSTSKGRLWGIQIVLLITAIIPELFVQHHPQFENAWLSIDSSWGFYAWYGFITCALMVIAAKILGVFLKRQDHYYDE